MNKIIYNSCFGGFGLSHEAVMLYAELSGLNLEWVEKWGLKHYFKGPITGLTLEEAYKSGIPDFYANNLERHDPILIKVVEQLGKAANGSCAKLSIYETESNQYNIEEYDGSETVVVSYDNIWKVIK